MKKLALISIALMFFVLGCVEEQNPEPQIPPVNTDNEPSPGVEPDIKTPAAIGDLVECTITESRSGFSGTFTRWPAHYFTIVYKNIGNETAYNIYTIINEEPDVGEDVVGSWDEITVAELPPGAETSANFGINVRLFQSAETRTETVIKTTLDNGTAKSCNLTIPVP